MFVAAAWDWGRARWRAVAGFGSFAGGGHGEVGDFVVFEFLFEVFAGGEEIEELVVFFQGVGNGGFEGVVEDFFAEVVEAGAAAFDLDEIGG